MDNQNISTGLKASCSANQTITEEFTEPEPPLVVELDCNDDNTPTKIKPFSSANSNSAEEVEEPSPTLVVEHEHQRKAEETDIQSTATEITLD